MGQTQQTNTNWLCVSFSGHRKFQNPSGYLLIQVVRDLGGNKYRHGTNHAQFRQFKGYMSIYIPITSITSARTIGGPKVPTEVMEVMEVMNVMEKRRDKFISLPKSA